MNNKFPELMSVQEFIDNLSENLINTDEKCKAITCTRDWYNEMPYPYEMVYLYNIDYGFRRPYAKT